MHMASHTIPALGKRRSHLGRRICGEQLHIPFLPYLASEKIQAEIPVAQSLSDSDYPPDAA